jgi:hypothetical protein
MKVEDITLSEIARYRKTNIAWLSLHEVYKLLQLLETENRIMVAQVYKKGK